MPRGLDAYSEPIVKVYEACVDELLINLAKHFNVKATGNTGSFEYEVEMLAKLGAIRRETASIIAKHVKANEPMIELAVQTAMLDALELVEPQLAQAARDGLLNDVEMDVSGSIQERLQSYSRQAQNQLNLVNSVMIEETLRTYRTGVYAASDAVKRLSDVQSALNAETGKVFLGTSTLQKAVRSSVQAMNRAGINGFSDSAGRKWSAEAYARMLVRTTCSNAANQGVMDRNREYGNDLIYVRTNATARPGCYPWQGKVISMENRARTVMDGDGKLVHAFAASETTYGQPDGIFGCNCHHGPMNVFIPRVSHVLGNDKMPGKAENDEAYALTQRQRALERRVRYAKRDLAMLDAAGADEETVARAKAKVRDAQKRVRELVNQNPKKLVRDYSREAIYN